MQILLKTIHKLFSRKEPANIPSAPSNELKQTRISHEFDITSYTPTNHENACICLIDIVNFSKWCNDKKPTHIFETMTLYNKFLSELIAPFDDVDKIELVGDSVLILAGFRDKHSVSTKVSSIIQLSKNILSRIDYIRSIFDGDTSVRIGVHVGDIFSGFIENPRKFQLFGNSINVASRLEQSSLAGTFTISECAYRFYLEEFDPVDDLNPVCFGNPVVSFFKGVGKIGSITGYIHMNKVLIADDDELSLISLKQGVHIKYALDSDFVYTIDECVEKMKQYMFDMCIVDIYFVNETSYNGLREFRSWERTHRRKRQKVIVASVSINEDTIRLYDDLVDGFIDKTKVFNLENYPDLEVD